MGANKKVDKTLQRQLIIPDTIIQIFNITKKRYFNEIYPVRHL